ncbi:MAG: hypothetical protein VWZ86_04980, partial [Flavobacteriaceae bacterium]
MQRDKLLSTLHFHFIVVIFGFTAVLGALISISAIPLVWYRMTLATAGLGVVLYFTKQSFRITKTIAWVAFVSGVLIALHWISFFGAVKVSNVSITLSGGLETFQNEVLNFARCKRISTPKSIVANNKCKGCVANG